MKSPWKRGCCLYSLSFDLFVALNPIFFSISLSYVRPGTGFDMQPVWSDKKEARIICIGVQFRHSLRHFSLERKGHCISVFSII